MNGSRQHLACSFMPACLRCRTLVDTNVLRVPLYELCCSVQGRLKAVFLCLRYVDIVAFGAWFVPAWCAQKKSRSEPKLGYLWSSCIIWQSELMIYFEVASSLQEEHFPCSHVLVAVGTPQCDDLDWEERLCRELATLTQTHTRASCCCYDVAVLLRLVVVKQQLLVLLLPSLVLSSLVTKNEKTKEKNDKKEKDDTSFCGYKKENQNRTAVTHSRTLLEKRESTTKGRGGKQKKNVTKSKESE